MDLIDCSSGGIAGSATAAEGKRMPGYQVPYAHEIKKNAEIMTMAVGLITHPEQANHIIESEQADLVAVAREALFNPMWLLRQRNTLSKQAIHPLAGQSRWWLERREKSSILQTRIK